MSGEATPGGKKKIALPAALAGGAVAIGAALFVVFAPKSEEAAGPVAATSDPAAQQTTDPNVSVAQTAPFGQSDPNAPAPPVPPLPDGASVTSPDGAAISFADESISYSAAFPVRTQ